MRSSLQAWMKAWAAMQLNASKEARKSQGGTANESVAEQIGILNEWLKNLNSFA